MACTVGCSQKEIPAELQWRAYLSWMKENQGEFEKVKKINQINLVANYYPAEFLAYQELVRSSVVIKEDYDSVLMEYKCSLTFRIKLAPETRAFNLLQYNIASIEEYKARATYLTFSSAEFIYLTVDETTYTPVLTSYEGYNELSNELVFAAVFQPEEYGCAGFEQDITKLRLTFEDPYWDMGVNHFTYDTEIIGNSPKIKFI
jgi:hypothetical protein